MISLLFTGGERKICSTIKKSQNIMSRVVVSYLPLTTILRFPNSESMNISQGKSTKFPIPSTSTTSSSSSVVTTLPKGYLLQ